MLYKLLPIVVGISLCAGLPADVQAPKGSMVASESNMCGNGVSAVGTQCAWHGNPSACTCPGNEVCAGNGENKWCQAPPAPRVYCDNTASRAGKCDQMDNKLLSKGCTRSTGAIMDVPNPQGPPLKAKVSEICTDGPTRTSVEDIGQHPSWCPPTPTKLTKTFNVTVDENNQADWSPVIADPEIVEWTKQVYQSPNATLFRGVLEMLEKSGYMAMILDALGPYFRAEMQQWATALNKTLAQVAVFDLTYELAGSCTSTVANTADGKGIVHGRNLDYIGYATPGYGGLFTDVIQVNFVKDDQIMYTCDTYASYVGCLTGMKPGKFSISLNQRYVNGQLNSHNAQQIIANNLNHVFFPNGTYNGAVAYCLFTRNTMFSGMSYSHVLDELDAVKLINSAYLTVGGINPGEGSITITDPGYSNVVYHIGQTEYEPGALKMCADTFCIVTNEDNLPTRGVQAGTDLTRFLGGKANLAAVTKSATGVTADTLQQDVMMQCPNFKTAGINPNGGFASTLSTVMSAKDLIHRTYLQVYSEA